MSCRLSTNPPLVKIHLSQDAYESLARSADRLGVSLGQLARVGTLLLINEIEKGEFMTEVMPEYKTGIRPGSA